MSVQDEITRISEAKDDIIDAIEDKGVDVPSNARVSDLAEYIHKIKLAYDLVVAQGYTGTIEQFGSDLYDRLINEITEDTVSNWGFTKNPGTYSKPSSGIPKADLASDVQTSLGKADTALQTHQDISGKANKSGDTFSGNITIPTGSAYTIPANTVIRPSSADINASAIAGTMIWHDLFAFCKRSVPEYYTSTDGSTWMESTLDKTLFAQKGNNSKACLTSTVCGARWVWGVDGTSLSWSNAEWLVIGVTYQSPTAHYTVKFESSDDYETWTVRHESTCNYSTAPVYFKLSTYSGDRYLRLTITKATSDAGTLNIGQIRLLTARYGSQGMGIELEYPYTWDENQNLTFKVAKINNVSVPDSPKFTDTTYPDATTSAHGLMTAADKTKLNGIATGATAVTETTVSDWGFTKNSGTYSKPSDGIPKTDLAISVQTSLGKADTALQSHQDISGKIDNTADGLNEAINKLSTETRAPANDDYYISQYANGGTKTTTYHRRPMSSLWLYINSKISAVLGLTATNYSGKAATAGNADKVNNHTVDADVPSNAKFTDTVLTQSDVSGWGFTKNTGTVTSVRINGQSYSPTNGIVDLGEIKSNSSLSVTTDENGVLHLAFVDKSEEESCISKTVLYAVGVDNVDPPTTGWTETIPDAVGRYLWTRRETRLPDGNRYYDFSVSSQFGSAPVTRYVEIPSIWMSDSWDAPVYYHPATIQGYNITPYTHVELEPTADQWQELAQQGVTSLQAVNDNGVLKLYCTGDTAVLSDPQMKAIIEELDYRSNSTSDTYALAHYEAVLPCTDWDIEEDTYHKTITIEGLLDNDVPLVDIDRSKLLYSRDRIAAKRAWGGVLDVYVTRNEAHFEFEEIPTVDIPIFFECRRKG